MVRRRVKYIAAGSYEEDHRIAMHISGDADFISALLIFGSRVPSSAPAHGERTEKWKPKFQQ